MAWYATLYASRLSGWHARWDEVELSCPSSTVGALLWTLLAIILTPLALVLAWFIFVAPKERGRTLKTQEEMQAESAADMDPASSAPDLRGTAQTAGDTVGSNAFARAR